MKPMTTVLTELKQKLWGAEDAKGQRDHEQLQKRAREKEFAEAASRVSALPVHYQNRLRTIVGETVRSYES